MSLQRGIPVFKCLMCRTNRHYECERHVNDGAVDAMDFVSTKCECPCEGDVRAPGALIDLVADLRNQIKGMEAYGSELRRRSQERDAERERNWQVFARILDALLVPDDEGNLGIESPSRTDLAMLVASWSTVREYLS